MHRPPMKTKIGRTASIYWTRTGAGNGNGHREPDSEVIFRPRDIPASYSTTPQPMQNVADFPTFTTAEMVPEKPPKLGHPDFHKLCSYFRGIAANRPPWRRVKLIFLYLRLIALIAECWTKQWLKLHFRDFWHEFLIKIVICSEIHESLLCVVVTKQVSWL